MTRLLAALAAVLSLSVGAAEAHGPPRLKTTQEIVLNATPEEVWEVIGNFNDIGWHPAVTGTDAPDGNTVDGLRVITLEGGATLTEELARYDAEKMTYSYRLNQDNVDVLPVTNYASYLTVKDEGGMALVEWRGAFYRGFPNNNPPAELNDDAAIEAVDALYQAGLQALAERFGSAEPMTN